MSSFKIPFEHEQSLQQWIESDGEYQNLLRKHRELIRSQITFTQSSFYMQINNNFKKTLTYLNKHAAVAVTVGLLAVSTITASAAELAAPTAFKPSTLIKGLFQPVQNTQTDTDPNKGLVEDPNNSIVKLDECGIAIKYPKQIQDNTITSKLITDHQSPLSKQTLSITGLNSTKPEANVDDENDSQSLSTPALRAVYVNCAAAKLLQAKGPNDEEKEISKETLKSYTGWHIADGDIQNITDLYNVESRLHLVRFSFGDNWYAIGFTEQEKNNTITEKDGSITGGIFGNQIQIQLASQVTDLVFTTPVEITKGEPIAQNPKNSLDQANKPLIQNAISRVSNFAQCDTAIQYPAPTGSGLDLTLRYVTNQDGSLSTSAVELITKAELDKGANLPTLSLECSKTPFDLLPDAQIMANNTKNGLFFTKETLDKSTVSRLSQTENNYGISLDSNEAQFEKRIITEFSTGKVYFRQIESVFIIETTGIDYGQYPFVYTRRASPNVSFQSTQAVPRPVGEILTPISTIPLPIVTLSPAQASSLIKTYNSEGDKPCTLDGTVSYSTVALPVSDSDSAKLAQMTIISRFQVKTESSKTQLGIFDSFISKAKNNSSIGLFANGCSGFASIHLYDVPVTYVGVDNVRGAVFLEGNGIGYQAVIRIYATRGVHVIELTKSVIASDYPTSSAFYNPIIESCSSGPSESLVFDRNCYDNKIRNNPLIKSKAQSRAQELVTTFAL